MSKRKRKEEEEGPLLPFDIPEPISPRKTYNVKDEPRPLWTKNKAKLIVRYLYYFVWVTKHGTYIDGFAGPQNKDREESWAAKLVLEDKPRWLRHFFLFDVKSKQAKLLEELRDTQPPPNPEYNEKKRDIQVKRGDFNVLVKDLLRSGQIGPKEATFCLLDQRTFECHWDTLKALAAYKTSGHKIELFYFLPNYWLNRAFSRQQDKQVIERWWGRSDWAKLPKMRTRERADLFTCRIAGGVGVQVCLCVAHLSCPARWPCDVPYDPCYRPRQGATADGDSLPQGSSDEGIIKGARRAARTGIRLERSSPGAAAYWEIA